MNKFYINNPKELKNKSIEELEEISKDIREFLVTNISETGGHIGSNLGVVELTIALHYVFNSPYDKILFDVGHQGYVHKILTGRSDRFNTLRQYKGLSGFLKQEESIHDVWEAGHSSTSISGAIGYAFSRDLEGKDNEVIAFIGDGSLTNGMAIEALNHISSLNNKVIIILNDNEMSISKNVGFIDDILQNLQYSKDYKEVKSGVKNAIHYLPFGDKINVKIGNFKNKIKYKISASESFFNLMGFDYFGPVDGHDFNKLFSILNKAKVSENSVIIHVKTIKGLGYEPAMNNKWHGVGPFDIETGKIKSNNNGICYAKVISSGLECLIEKDPNIVVITPAMCDGSKLNNIKDKYPNNFTDVGICEEHAITFAAGLALDGKKPFVSIYSTFLQRGYDQLFHDVIRQKANVVIGVDRAGIVGEDGETHQGIYDISFMSHMKNMVIMQGKNDIETLKLLQMAFKIKGPVAIRYPRGGDFNEVRDLPNCDIKFGEWEYLRFKNSNNIIISYGEILNNILDLDIDCFDIINARFILPLDEKVLESIKDKNIIVIEEHIELGGLKTLISNYYNNKNILKIIKGINFKDDFVEQGDRNILLEEYNLIGKNLKEKILELLNEKKN